MKRIEDEDARPDFDKVWNDFCEADYLVRDYVHLAEHFFQAGRDSLAREFWTSKPKRTIQTIVKSHNSNLYALSTDGKVFYLNTGGVITDNMKWIQLPDLPQED